MCDDRVVVVVLYVCIAFCNLLCSAGNVRKIVIKLAVSCYGCLDTNEGTTSGSPHIDIVDRSDYSADNTDFDIT